MIELTNRPIDVTQVIDSTRTQKAGGHVHFIGTVREEGDLKGLFYECYPPMALKVLQAISEEAKVKWTVAKVSVVHRYGWVPLGEASVVAAVSSAHRREAFTACQYVIDQLKERVPIWKREKEQALPLLCPSTSLRMSNGNILDMVSLSNHKEGRGEVDPGSRDLPPVVLLTKGDREAV